MKLSLSTNWCNRRIERGEDIAEKALSLGFSELELGYHTTIQQVDGFKRMRDRITIGSVHAFCPVPISAPQGYPELYQLASFDDEMRRMARFHVIRNIEFADSMGADTVVLHAGRVMCDSWFNSLRLHRRAKRGERMVQVFCQVLEELVPVLEKYRVTLALENLPYFEGFPNDVELDRILGFDFGGWIKGWFDTGHDHVCKCNGWKCKLTLPRSVDYVGMHINDVIDKNDDHLAPGAGSVDFAALVPFMKSMRHVVFEPSPSVSELDLRQGVSFLSGMLN